MSQSHSHEAPMTANLRPPSRTILQRIALTLMLPVVATSQAATITVNSIADTVANDGHCTLREAINSANSNVASGGMPGECVAGQALPTVDVIAFNIPGAGVHTISPSTQLIITQAVKIDGYTQPGSSVNTLAIGDNAVLRIEIAGGAVDGVIQLNGPFSVDSSGSTIRGLVIDQNSGRSIFVGNGFGNGSNNDTIVGNFLGVDPTGMTVTSTNTPINAVSSTNLVVGGSSPADRNVISALNQDPIFFNQTSSSFVQGNYIGVNAAGTASLGAFEGILLIQGSTNDKIGGSGAGEGNVIYGSFKAIRIDTSDTTTIQGNFIGTDATGSSGFGPSFGIGIESSSGTIIGGSGPGAGNVISGNIVGIQVGNSAPGTIIQGNKIGTDIGGTQPVPNTGSGIRLTGNVPGGGSIIGGSNPGEGNTIANSCGIGVEFNQQVANWPILGNSMYANGYGIALQPSNEPAINDTGDADTGANNLQNQPVITSAPISAGNVTITGTLNSIANTQYRVEFFSSVDCNRSGFGEGRTFLGFANVTTGASGNASFNALTFAVPAGQIAIAATATDPNGNTSEFSMCVGGIGRLFANGFEQSCPGG
jgi:CSLREA domain-containing protein